MKKFLNIILSFFKKLFGDGVSINIKNEKKYDIKKNSNCNININENGGSKK